MHATTSAEDERHAIVVALNSVEEMWGRRYDTDTAAIPSPVDGDPFGCAVAVDLGALAEVRQALWALAVRVYPDMERRKP